MATLTLIFMISLVFFILGIMLGAGIGAGNSDKQGAIAIFVILFLSFSTLVCGVISLLFDIFRM